MLASKCSWPSKLVSAVIIADKQRMTKRRHRLTVTTGNTDKRYDCAAISIDAMTKVTITVCQNQQSVSNCQCWVGNAATEWTLITMFLMLTATYHMNNAHQSILMFVITCLSSTLCPEKRGHVIFDYNSCLSWWIFIIFLPLETGMNTAH